MGYPVASIRPTALLPFKYPERALHDAWSPGPNLTVARGTVMGQVAAGVNDVDTVSVSGSAGTFTVTVANNAGTQTTPAQAFNVSTAALQAALLALTNVPAGIVVTGTAGTSYVITDSGAGAGQPLGVVTAAGTGGATATNVHTTSDIAPGQSVPYASGNTDGSQKPVWISDYDFTTDQNGNITLGQGAIPVFGLTHGYTQTVPGYFTGIFRESDLVGLDTNAVAAFGAREMTLADGTKQILIPGP